MKRAYLALSPILLFACASPTEDVERGIAPQSAEVVASASETVSLAQPEVEASAEPQVTTPLEIGEAVRLALSISPEMEAARARVLGVRAIGEGAGSWTEPTLTAGVEGLPLESPREEEEYLVGITFALPALGAMGAERDVARAESSVARAALQSTLLQTDQQVREAFGEALAAQHAAELALELDEIHRKRYAVALAEWEAGAGTEVQALDDQLAAARSTADTVAALRGARTARVLLNRLLPASAHGRGLGGDLDIALALPELDAMLARIGELPTMEEARAEVRLARLRAELGEARRIPEVGINLNWRRLGDGRSAVDAIVGVGLPLGGRRAADARGERYSAAEAAALARARWRDVGAELTLAHAAAADARDRLTAIEEHMLPVVERAEALVLARVELGSASRSEAMGARIAVLELEFEALQARADYQAAWVVLRPYLLGDV